MKNCIFLLKIAKKHKKFNADKIRNQQNTNNNNIQ